jgi:hypothetical protein
MITAQNDTVVEAEGRCAACDNDEHTSKKRYLISQIPFYIVWCESCLLFILAERKRARDRMKKGEGEEMDD